MEQQTTNLPQSFESTATQQPMQPIPHPNHDTHSYRGWLNSDRFYKRALAAYGYMFVGSFMVAAAFMIPFFFLAVLGGLSSL